MLNLPFFIKLKRDFFGLFGAIWFGAGLLMLIISVPVAFRIHDSTAVFLGLVFTVIGGRLFFKSLQRIRSEDRLQREGLSAEAEVIGVEEADYRYNRRPQWVVRYRFTDRMDGSHEGRSGYLEPEEAAAWKVGDHGVVRFDPKRPTLSMWIGKT